MNKLHKNERQTLIKQMINQYTIRSQEDLITRLQKEHVDITQATISRDIRDLGIVKTIDEQGKPKFTLYNSPQTQGQVEKKKLVSLFNDVVIKIEHVQFLTIIHTLPDNASLLAAIIDEVHFPEVKCSLAGFDTVVLIVSDETYATEMENYFNEIWQAQTDEQLKS
ncbi:MAG: ArgR family transcriptional regulator [Tetragenococcus koreensis]|nr:ArgR family transcriptional regulator [Tetragenococcus koreensis]MCF1584689.1 ArgR family transcriptional regulator [Tetragenococcus koreensis]MCF1624083.1 ArgR family transcriptional regulator [Tetragenococcus koreensis]MDN6289368.1 ArgR family transcriptional regulator [Tetragenococcus koreensis]MDN6383165.1 ArgR family transcriptional regulator [Tetragenococcus koreensis]MDN6733233.1 ArgR family transcriptional regulator [Tetragenococcus koreensis]